MQAGIAELAGTFRPGCQAALLHILSEVEGPLPPLSSPPNATRAAAARSAASYTVARKRSISFHCRCWQRLPQPNFPAPTTMIPPQEEPHLRRSASSVTPPQSRLLLLLPRCPPPATRHDVPSSKSVAPPSRPSSSGSSSSSSSSGSSSSSSSSPSRHDGRAFSSTPPTPKKWRHRLSRWGIVDNNGKQRRLFLCRLFFLKIKSHLKTSTLLKGLVQPQNHHAQSQRPNVNSVPAHPILSTRGSL